MNIDELVYETRGNFYIEFVAPQTEWERRFSILRFIRKTNLPRIVNAWIDGKMREAYELGEKNAQREILQDLGATVVKWDTDEFPFKGTETQPIKNLIKQLPRSIKKNPKFELKQL